MNKRKIAAILLAALIFSAVLTGCSGSQKTVATVNDTAITEKQLDDYLLMMQLFYPTLDSMIEQEGAPDEFKQQMLDAIIELELILQESERLELEPTEEKITEITAEFQEYLETTVYGSVEDLDQRIAELEISQDTLTDFYRRQTYYDVVIDHYKSQITDEEIEAFVDENSEMMEVPASAEISHILVEEEAEAEEVLQQLDSGKTFAELAAEFSIDEANAEAEGALGRLYEKDPNYNTVFIEAAFALEEGGISQPVGTDYGWHIIKAENLEDSKTLTIDEVKEELLEMMAGERFTNELDRLLSEAEIDNTLVKDTEEDTEE